jgi:hypothetical protein
LAGALALASVLWLVTAVPASADVVLGMSSTIPTVVMVGDTNVPASISIKNNNNGAEATMAATLTEISVWPSCGSEALFTCDTPDPGVFTLSPTATGAAGSACAGQNFTVTAPDATGKVSFTPANQVVIAPGATCTIDFTFSVVKTPAIDARPEPGFHTYEIGLVQGRTPNGSTGRGTYFSVKNVFRDDPTISTTASDDVVLGGTVSATATLAGGTAPTGSITFDLFPPSDTNCTGTPVFTSTVPVNGNGTYQSGTFQPTQPGTYRWTSRYSGDANNDPAGRTPCANQAGHVFVAPLVGELRVTTNPPLPSQILVDGIPRDTFGLAWLDLPPGSYTVGFTHVEGFTEPAPQTVNVTAGATTTVQGNFVQRGSLRVTTNPAVPATIIVDGIPRNDWGMWTDLPTGAHQVCFGPVANFAPPPCQNVTLTAGNLTTVTGNYTSSPGAAGPSGTGELRVTTSPALPSQILVNGVPRDSWGLTWLDLPPGTYTVSFTHVEGWTEPAPQTVTVTAGTTTNVVGTFTQRGFLRVVTSPAVPGTISVDGVPRNDWGMWTDLATGAHEVCFGPVPGFNTPPCHTVSLSPGGLFTLTGSYTPT